MQDELLKYLKSSLDRDWLQYYVLDSDSIQPRKQGNNSSQELYRLTKSRLVEISRIAVTKSKKNQQLTIFVIEPNPLQFIAILLAGIIAEVQLFLCDPAWRQQEWQQVLNLVQPDLVYGSSTTKNLITQLSTERKNHLDHQFKISKSASALIMIPTGGTSGKIRFAIHSWDTLVASATGFKDYFSCQKINSCCTLPLYHVSGLMQFIRSFITQGNLVICPYKLVASQQMNLNQQDYFISLVPTQLQFLIESNPEYLSQFKTVLLGGAPAMRSLLDTARKYKIAIALIYGMTETASGIVALKSEDFLAGNNSNGQVLPHAKVRINVAESNNNNNSNYIGLIKINCSSLCLGYYPHFFDPNQPFTTDDLGYFDHDNYLHLVGRNSQKIITGGENVFPREIETIIQSTKLVKDVRVIGIPDPKWGEAVTAIYIPLNPETNLELIKQKVISKLAKYKLPKHWIEVDHIPCNNRGKTNYQELKAIAIGKISNE